MSCGCNNSLSLQSLIGPTGVGIASVTGEISGSNYEFTFTYTNGDTEVITVAAPAAGATGAQGVYGGFSSVWQFTDVVGGGSASTELGFNSNNFSLVTTLKVSDTNADSINVDGLLDSLDNSGNFGLIRVFKESDSTQFVAFEVTNVVDSGTYHTLTVTYKMHNGTFADNDSVVLTFAPKGNAGTSASCDNVGSGAELYIDATSAPFEIRTLISPNSTITLTENGNEVELDLNVGAWVECNAQGSGVSTTNPVYQTPGSGFTGLANASGFNTLAFKSDIATNKIVLKGCAKLTGAGVIGLTPTGSFNNSTITVCTLPTSLSPSAGVQHFATCQLYNPVTKHSSCAVVVIAAGAMVVVIDHRLNYVDANTYISFENTMYSKNNS